MGGSVGVLLELGPTAMQFGDQTMDVHTRVLPLMVRQIAPRFRQLTHATAHVAPITLHECGRKNDQSTLERIPGDQPARLQDFVTGEELTPIEQLDEPAQRSLIEALRVGLRPGAHRPGAASVSDCLPPGVTGCRHPSVMR